MNNPKEKRNAVLMITCGLISMTGLYLIPSPPSLGESLVIFGLLGMSLLVTIDREWYKAGGSQ